jgi:hypothetical protein
MLQDQLAIRKETFQRGVDLNEVKRKRYEDAVVLRKVHRQKRAMMLRSDLPDMANSAEGGLSCFPKENGPEMMNKLQGMLKFLEEIPSSEIKLEDIRDLRATMNSIDGFEMAINTTVIPKLIGLLAAEDPAILFEVLWVLTNIASAPAMLTCKLVALQVIPTVTPLIGHPVQEVNHQALWVLGNLASDGIRNSKLILETGVLSKLESQIDSGDPHLVEIVAWFLETLFNKVSHCEANYIEQAFTLVPKLICQEDDDTLVLAASLFCKLLERASIKSRALIDASFGVAFSRAIRSREIPLQEVGLRMLGSVSNCSEESVGMFLKAGVLDHIDHLLVTGNRFIKKSALWMLSNLLACRDEVKFQVIRHSIYAHMTELVANDDPGIIFELLFCFANACHNVKPDVVLDLAQKRGLEILVAALSIDSPEFLLSVLELIELVFKCAYSNTETLENKILQQFDQHGGTTKLNSLMSTSNSKIYSKVRSVLEKYVDANEEESSVDQFALVSAFNFS